MPKKIASPYLPERIPLRLNKSIMYIRYVLKIHILQIAVLDYFLTSTFTNTTFHFPDYLKQS